VFATARPLLSSFISGAILDNPNSLNCQVMKRSGGKKARRTLMLLKSSQTACYIRKFEDARGAAHEDDCSGTVLDFLRS
jgi:hypothetical protein